ncbi:MAG TPA: hypothetical protein VE053_06300 [Allosphingosinicella sp.]|nr:hypothetical protein [Allosphingosinicella sp.]
MSPTRLALLPSLDMGRTLPLPGAILLALMTALWLAVAGPAHAAGALSHRTISNVATIEWESAGGKVGQQSNRIDIDVGTASFPLSLSLYRFAGNSALLSMPVSAPRCGPDGPGVRLATAWNGQRLDPAAVIAASEILPGEPFLFLIEDSERNRDPGRIETIDLVVRAQSGDSESLTVFETAADSGKFAGFIQTIQIPPVPAGDDCRLSVEAGDHLIVESLAADNRSIAATATLEVLADPFGFVFDSADGKVLSGARVTLIDDSTGQPAKVFGDDGDSDYPSSVVTGESVTDSGGTVYSFSPGLFRFPLIRPGVYRLRVEPPQGYTAPSVRTPAEMADLRTPRGRPFTIVDASYGGTFTIAGPEPVRVSIPLDGPRAPIHLAKQASRADAAPGEAIVFTVDVRNSDAHLAATDVRVTDVLPPALRLRPRSLRVDGQAATAQIAADGSSFTVTLPSLAAGASRRISYAAEVKPGAAEGDAINRVGAVGAGGLTSNVSDAIVRIRRDGISGRMTILGRVTDGGCGADPAKAAGVAGVRVMLEDGSYAVTDLDGRYHFEGVLPGTHVVQLDDMTLPADRAAADCARNSRSAGRAFSRFVDGRGGALKRVDFKLVAVSPRASLIAAARPRPVAATDPVAAGAERDWLAGQAPGIAWLFPEPEHNPRAPMVRAAIKHLPGQSVKLLADGRAVDPIAFEGSRKNAEGSAAVSLWRGIPVEGRQTELSAEIRNADGSLAETLRRTVRYGASPMRAELLREQSVLVADGVSRPVLAVRLTDRDGRPVRHGLTGDFEVPAPYYPAVEADAQQARQLAGLERARPFWRVSGEAGVAYIELEPTTASGTISLRFNFRDGEAEREQRVEAWLDPGQRPWTIVGLAEGTVGYNRLQGKVEDLDEADEKLLTDARVALYAKGRIRGKWLMTLAYDSDKKEDETRFGGIIDPDAYYTVYADRSERRYDAASVRKLYLKLERPQFYALFGDYETGIDEPELARYVRAFNGVKAEYRSDRVSATAFAADSPNRHRHDEIQGNGLSGPYALGARNILANSERVSIEIRDRLRSDKIVERRLLTRHVDYDIDYSVGTLRFKEPILSRSSALDPQFIIADYEIDGIANRTVNAGGRATWRSKNQKVQVGATAISDSDGTARTNLAGADVRYRPNLSTEVRAEIAVSDNRADAGSEKASTGTATAWQVEAEHHGSSLDLLAYVRQRDSGFGLGQTGAAENGTRKVGLDARVRFGDTWSLIGSAWHEEYLGSDARRIAAKALVEYRTPDFAARAGLTFADDRLADGRSARSTLLTFGATKRLFDNKLELDGQTEIPLGNSESIDFPARHRLSARYAVTSGIQLVGAYEIADGEKVDARTARLGVDVQPWAGARIALSGNVQDIAEYGPRSFAAFGLSQSLVLDEHWSVDASVDANKSLGGIDPARVLNPLHPVASGGFVGGGSGTIAEDFTALTAGATYRADRWSVTGRAEYRAGDQGDRYGVTAAALRQMGEGEAVGGALNWFVAKGSDGAETRTTNLQLSWAHRPAGSRWSWLEKFELREDRVTGAVAGAPGPIGIPLTISGDARSRRLVNALSINYSAQGGSSSGRSEISLFWGSRYVSEKLGNEDIGGWSNVVGADFRFDLSDTIDVGFAGTVRAGLGGDSFAWSAGPNVGFTPFENGWVSIGWNFAGFHDRDFEEARYTRNGPYVTMRLKFDQLSLEGLGIGRRR